MSHDRSSVEAVVQHYFDALYEGDADKLGAVFHPSADLRSLEKGELKSSGQFVDLAGADPAEAIIFESDDCFTVVRQGVSAKLSGPN